MRTVVFALSEKRRMDCDGYLFPGEYYDIPGVEEFRDLDAVVSCAVRKMRPYAGQQADIYLNGGLSVEVLAALQAAKALDMRVNVMHYHAHDRKYISQEVRWKPLGPGPEAEPVMLVLCRGRHQGMEGPFIFSEISEERIFDFSWQEKQVRKCLEPIGQRRIGIYLSGLTSLFISVLNVAGELQLPVTFFHYDYDTEDYFPQFMDRIPGLKTENPGSD